MAKQYSTKTLLAAAIVEQRADDAQKYYDLVCKEYAPGPLPILMEYDQARILLIRQEVTRPLEILENMRRKDGSPLGTLLFIKALVEFQVRRELAEALFAEFLVETAKHVPAPDGDLPRSYYEQQASELRTELDAWADGSAP